MREKLIEFIRKADKEDYESRTQDEHYAYMADHLIDNDVVTVVRCKDCKHRYIAESGVIFCTQHLTMSANDDDFCSYGERKDNERKAD